MYQIIIDKIKQYDKIVIHRHKNPDLDALGSQLGLKGVIEKNFPGKAVEVVGDENDFAFIGRMNNHLEDAFYHDALVIIVDVAVKALISDDRYTLGKEVLVIDHHLNASDVTDLVVSDPSHIATCQLLVDMVMQYELDIDAKTATQLYSGLLTDSGRFLYPSTSALSFKCAWFLMENGADIQFVHENLYVEDLNYKKLKGYFINHFQVTDQNVAYMKNTRDLKDKFNVPTFTISRGMVNQMSGIRGINIWANFTEDDQGDIQCELRSKEIPIVDVAKKYGGGGHALACGCTVSSWETTDRILADLDQKLQEEGISYE